MKVLFVYANNVPYPKDINLGIAHLSAMLKEHGHEAALVDTTFGMKDGEILERVKKADAGLIAMSSVYNNFLYTKHVAALIKSHVNTPILIGGVHATVAAEQTIASDCFDMLCVGEGEDPLLNLVNSMAKGEKNTAVRSLWFKQGGSVIKNPVQSFCKDIDELPDPDREIFDLERYLAHHNRVTSFMGSRGCPYRCAYCVNRFNQKLYEGMGTYVRYRSAERVVGEIKRMIAKYPIETVNFYDDTFTLDLRRVVEFCDLYRRQVGLPFHVNARIDTITDDMCRALSDAGCRRVSIGVEAGDPGIRKRVLARNITNEQIVEGCRLLKKHGLDIYTFNMIGIPGERWASIKRTIELNRRIRPNFMAVSIFTAYPGTALYDECEEQGIIDKYVPVRSYYERSNVRHPYLSHRKLNRIRKWFGFLVFIRFDAKRAFMDVLDRHLITWQPYVKLRTKLVKSLFQKRREVRAVE